MAGVAFGTKKKGGVIKKAIYAKLFAFLLPAVLFVFTFILIIVVAAAAVYNANKWAIDAYQTANSAYKSTVEFFVGKPPSPLVPDAVMKALRPIEEKYQIPWVFIYAISQDTKQSDFEKIAMDMVAQGWTKDHFQSTWKDDINKYATAIANGTIIISADVKKEDFATGYADKLLNSLGKYMEVSTLIYPMEPKLGIVTEWFGTLRTRADGSHYRHAGVDVAAPEGTDLWAAHAGTVTAVYKSTGGGNTVEVESDDKSLKTRYLHMREKSPLNVGDKVNQGDVVGHMGATGLVTGVHVHFEVYMNGVLSDPRDYVTFPRVRDGAGIGLDMTTNPTSNMR